MFLPCRCAPETDFITACIGLVLQLCPGVLHCCQTLAVLSAVAAVLAGSQHPSCSCHGLLSSRTILVTGVRRGVAPVIPGALLGVCPAGGGVVQAPAFESHFVHLLSELLDYFSLSSALRGLRVYALESARLCEGNPV